jgi:hypothetical protein
MGKSRSECDAGLDPVAKQLMTAAVFQSGSTAVSQLLYPEATVAKWHFP